MRVFNARIPILLFLLLSVILLATFADDEVMDLDATADADADATAEGAEIPVTSTDKGGDDAGVTASDDSSETAATPPSDVKTSPEQQPPVDNVNGNEDDASASKKSDADVVSPDDKAATTDPEKSAPGGAAADTTTATTTTTPKDDTEAEPVPSPEKTTAAAKEKEPPVQSGPFIDLLGPNLLKLEMLDETHAQLQPLLTLDGLRGKKVIGLYFSADWCGPCRKFTPELTSFYNKMNARRGKKDEFEIVWVSRCRDVESFGQYFTQMGGWLALPPEQAMGERGKQLSDQFKVKGIPTLVLLDDLGSVITRDGRNKIPQDKAGIGFPWRNPVATLYMTVLPRSLRLMIKSQITGVKDQILGRLKSLLIRPPKKAATATA